MAKTSTSFQKGHKAKGGPGTNGQLRRDLTIELVSNLNKVVKEAEFKKYLNRERLEVVVDQLVLQAMRGDLMAIQAVWDRLEGRSHQKVVGPDNGPVKVEYKSIEEVKMFLIERGIDTTRLAPPLRVVNQDE
jgi:hypothetical protein